MNFRWKRGPAHFPNISFTRHFALNPSGREAKQSWEAFCRAFDDVTAVALPKTTHNKHQLWHHWLGCGLKVRQALSDLWISLICLSSTALLFKLNQRLYGDHEWTDHRALWSVCVTSDVQMFALHWTRGELLIMWSWLEDLMAFWGIVAGVTTPHAVSGMCSNI